MEPYKYKGEVHFISPLQTFQSGFAKRTLVLKEAGESKYPNYAAFEFSRSKDGTRDGTRQLDKLLVGEPVEVSFYLDANESKRNPGSWFTSNRGVKVERLAVAKDIELVKDKATQAEPEPTLDDIPF